MTRSRYDFQTGEEISLPDEYKFDTNYEFPSLGENVYEEDDVGVFARDTPKSTGLLKESDMIFGKESEWHRSGAWFQLRAGGIWKARELRLKLTAGAASQH